MIHGLHVVPVNRRSLIGPTHAAKADCVPGQTGVGKPGGFAQPAGGAQGRRWRFPGAAAEHVFCTVGWAAGILSRARSVVILVEDVLTPLGHVAVHVEETPGIRPLLSDWMGLFPGIIHEPGEIAEL